MRNTIIPILIFSVFFFGIRHGISAASTLKEVVLNSEIQTAIQSNSYVIEDASGALTIKQILSPAYIGYFEKHDVSLPYNEHKKSVYWKKIILKNVSNYKTWLLEFPDPHIGSLELFVVDGDKVEFLGRSGFDLDFGQRSLEHKNFLYQLSFPESGKLEVYARFHSKRFCSFHLNIRSIPNTVNYFLLNTICSDLLWNYIHINGL